LLKEVKLLKEQFKKAIDIVDYNGTHIMKWFNKN
jgi:hypothetical protein